MSDFELDESKINNVEDYIDDSSINEKETASDVGNEASGLKPGVESTQNQSDLSQVIARAVTEKTGRTEEDDEVHREYTIGGYTFQTYYEYRSAEDDVRKIDLLRQELDLQDPEVAIRVYYMIRDGKLTFESPIGEEFSKHVADIVADRSVDLLEDKAVIDEAEDQAQGQKRIAALVLVVALLAFGYFAYSEISDVIQTRHLSELQAEREKTRTEVTVDSGEAEDIVEDGAEDGEDSESSVAHFDSEGNSIDTLTVLPEFESFLSQNADFVGWLTIPDTQIDYPVVQRAEDNEYYLNHAFDGGEDKNGTIFLDYRSSITVPTTNTILYGHDMKSGLMFGELSNYLDMDYLSDHKIIEFNTLYETRQYEVIAVGLSEVQDSDSDSFRYYNFINASTQGEWDTFYDFVASVNVYGDVIDMTSTDQLLTLSTCNSYMTDGRLFVLAKRID